MSTTTSPIHHPRRADPARRLRDVLRPAILCGAHGPRPLPDEGALAAAHRVSRNTVREALDLLRGEGLVERRRGSGTFVISRTAANRLTGLLGLSEYTPADQRVDNVVLFAETCPVPPPVAVRLEIEPDARIVVLERVRRVAGDVVSLDTSYLPAALTGDLLDRDLSSGDLFGVLEQQLGLELTQAEVMVEAFGADRATASCLGVAPGSPLLAVDRLVRLKSGTPIALEFVRYRPDRVVLTCTASRNPGDPP